MASTERKRVAVDMLGRGAPRRLPVPRATTGHQTNDLVLPSGRRVEIAVGEAGEALRVVGGNGRVELTVQFTEVGAKLLFEAADIELRAAETVSVACARFDVQARDDVRIIGPRAAMQATAGDLELRANDHVIVVGEQIRLNCDVPDTVPDWMQKALGAQIAGAQDNDVSIPATDITGDPDLIAKFDR